MCINFIPHDRWHELAARQCRCIIDLPAVHVYCYNYVANYVAMMMEFCPDNFMPMQKVMTQRSHFWVGLHNLPFLLWVHTLAIKILSVYVLTFNGQNPAHTTPSLEAGLAISRSWTASWEFVQVYGHHLQDWWDEGLGSRLNGMDSAGGDLAGFSPQHAANQYQVHVTDQMPTTHL